MTHRELSDPTHRPLHCSARLPLPREERMAFWRQLAARDVGAVPTIVVATESVFRPLDYFRTLVSDTGSAVHPLRPYLSRFMILDWREQVAR